MATVGALRSKSECVERCGHQCTVHVERCGHRWDVHVERCGHRWDVHVERCGHRCDMHLERCGDQNDDGLASILVPDPTDVAADV